MSQVAPENSAAAPSPAPERAGHWREPVIAWLVTRILCVVCLYAGATFWPIERVLNLERAQRQPKNKQNLRHAGDKADLLQFYHDYRAGFGQPDWLMKSPMVFVTVGGDWAWAKPLIHWDTLWWLSVAEVGYVADPKLEAKVEQNVVFYPLYPLLIRGLKSIGIHPILGGLLIANSVMLLATCLFYRLAVEQFGANSARWTLWLWLSFPTSFFGTVPYSEPLMMLLSVLSMRAFLQQKYVASGLLAGVASALRNQGVLLGSALLVPFFCGPKRFRALIGGLCSGLGLLIYMGYLWSEFGDPLYFLQAQKVWRPAIDDANPLLFAKKYMISLLHSLYLAINGGPPLEYYSGRLCDPWLGLWVLIWLPAVWKWNRGLFVVALSMIALPFATGTAASLGRYVWAILPVFLVMGHQLRQSRLRWLILTVSLGLLMWQAYLYGGGWEVI